MRCSGEPRTPLPHCTVETEQASLHSGCRLALRHGLRSRSCPKISVVLAGGKIKIPGWVSPVLERGRQGDLDRERFIFIFLSPFRTSRQRIDVSQTNVDSMTHAYTIDDTHK